MSNFRADGSRPKKRSWAVHGDEPPCSEGFVADVGFYDLPTFREAGELLLVLKGG